MSGVASVGLLVTLPPEYAVRLEVAVQCPRCWSKYVGRGAGAFADVAVWVNWHEAHECLSLRGDAKK